MPRIPQYRRTHTGSFLGVPVYLDMTNPDIPTIEGRYLGCDYAIWLMELLFGVFCTFVSMFNPDFEPLFPIKITGVIENESHTDPN